MQLLDAASGHHLWVERYVRDRSDPLAMQDGIATAISSATLEKLGAGLHASVYKDTTLGR
jgi:TolB-like protein